MDCAATSAAPAERAAAGDASPFADASSGLTAWLEAFADAELTGDAVALDDIAALIATAEPAALAMLADRLEEFLEDVVAAAEATGEEIPESLIDAVEGVIAAIDLSLTPAVPVAGSATP